MKDRRNRAGVLKDCKFMMRHILLGIFLLGALGSLKGEVPLDPGSRPKVSPPKPAGNTPDPAVAEPPKEAVAEGPVKPDVLMFFSGDKLQGKLTGIEADGTILWTHPEAKTPLQFLSKNAEKIVLPGGGSGGRTEHAFTVKLVNGNQFPADIISLDGDRLLVNTWYGGQITVVRKMIDCIVPRQKSSLLYEGPTSMEGWVSGRGNRRTWDFKDEALINSKQGLIGRDLKLPDKAKLDFDMAWTGNLSLLLSLYVPSVENYSNNCYMLQLNSGYLYLNRSSNRGGQNNLGQVQIEEMNRKNKAHIALRMNKEQKTIALIMDGALVKQWKDPGEFAGTGTGICFYAQGQGTIRISNIEMSDWDGRMDELGGGGTAVFEQDTVTMQNKDKVSGKLVKIENKNMTFESSFAKLDIPLERVGRIDFSGDKKNTEKADSKESRIKLVGDGNITLRLEKMTRDKASGASQSLGKLELKPEAFRQIDFNLERKRSDEESSLMENTGNSEEGGEDF